MRLPTDIIVEIGEFLQCEEFGIWSSINSSIHGMLEKYIEYKKPFYVMYNREEWCPNTQEIALRLKRDGYKKFKEYTEQTFHRKWHFAPGLVSFPWKYRNAIRIDEIDSCEKIEIDADKYCSYHFMRFEFPRDNAKARSLQLWRKNAADHIKADSRYFYDRHPRNYIDYGRK